MSQETVWIEQFTGMSLIDGASRPGVGLAAAGAAFEKKRMAQLALLYEVREKLQAFKAGFQAAMAAEVKAGRLKGQKLLVEAKTQTAEVDFADLKISDVDFSPEAGQIVAKGSQLVISLNERLKGARINLDGKSEPLFTALEIQAEYWTPLMRERILPETYIPDVYSETQRMLDETNALYLDAVEDRRAQDKLTPQGSRGEDIVASAAEVLDLGGKLIKDFAPGTPDFKLAMSVIGTSATVLRQGAKIYDQIGARKFIDTSSTALDVMGTVTAVVLQQCGIPEKTTKIVEASFAAGGAALAAGQAFAKGVDGVEDGLNALAIVSAKALGAALIATAAGNEETRQALSLAASAVPGSFKLAALAADLRQKVLAADYAGIVDCLSKAMKAALTSVQELREIKATQGKTPEEATEIKKQMKAQTADLAVYFDLGTAVAALTVKTATTARKGEHLATLNVLINGIGASLEKVLTVAGVSEKEAKLIGGAYKAVASAPAALESLMSNPPKVDQALNKLSAGIASACALSGDDQLTRVGKGLGMSLDAVATGLRTKALYEQDKYNEGISAFCAGVQEQLKTVFPTPKAKKDDAKKGNGDGATGAGDTSAGGDAPTGDAPEGVTLAKATEAVDGLLADLSKATKDAGKSEASYKKLLEAERQLRAKQAAAAGKADQEEAALILEEAQAELDALSEAAQAGAQASSIDRLIAKLERDRMVFQLAKQIAEGGTAFLAKFVPVLGAASAAVKLAASLYAAGQRAQQLYRWTQLQDDFEAAQSALSSSSRDFVKNQRDQLASASAQALWAATALAGEIAKLTGLGSAAGVILNAAASTGSALQTIVEKHKSREELETAWAKTAAALRNPGNRNLGLEARALNGTLAKYAIAWGAVTLKDPLARNAMKACDLNEASLEDENSNVGKVVAYLETFFAEDASLYRELDETPDWVPDDLRLSLKSWVRLKRQATEKSQLSVGETGKLDGWLALYEVQSADQSQTTAANKARHDWAAALEAAAKAAGPGERPAVPIIQQKAMATKLEAQIEAIQARVVLLEKLMAAFKAFVPQKKAEAEKVDGDGDAAAMLRAVALLVKQSDKLATGLRQDAAGLQAQFDEINVAVTE